VRCLFILWVSNFAVVVSGSVELHAGKFDVVNVGDVVLSSLRSFRNGEWTTDGLSKLVGLQAGLFTEFGVLPCRVLTLSGGEEKTFPSTLLSFCAGVAQAELLLNLSVHELGSIATVAL